jgi:hypothetical protein
MGTGNYMYQDVSEAAQKILDFQLLSIEHETQDLSTYPMMDGIYVVSEEVNNLLDFIDNTFEDHADRIVNEELEEIYLIRGGISFGPIVEGDDFEYGEDSDDVLRTINSLLIGSPMVEAFNIEDEAPPFGIAIHDSARAFTESGFQYQWYNWFEPDHLELANDLRKEVEEYFEESKNHCHMTNYPEEKIDHHAKLLDKYLPEVKLKNNE